MKLPSSALPLSFYSRPTERVARELLGKLLVRTLNSGQILVGKIVETEAYLGISDRACHTFGDRKTPRTEPMYGDGGHAYIYLIYGMYDCFNVVTERAGVPEAVLIRALEPIEGIEVMSKLRNTSKLRNLCSGPGKLCQALQIDRSLNKHRLDSPPLLIAESEERLKKSQIIKTTRIGVDYAGEDAQRALRFYIKDNLFVSKR